MNFDSLSQEQQIMLMMRKTLTNIIRDTTPPPGTIHPLSEQNIQDIRECLLLISTRERELMEEKGVENTAKPRYADEPKTTQTVSFVSKPK